MIRIGIVQQSAWDIPMDTVPLASGYLKATVESDPDLSGEVAARIYNFRGGASRMEMVKALLSDRPPDILALSIFGWNYRNFIALAETYKQVRPDGLVVMGGNHVSYQAERVFHETTAVDVVVNGEGEFPFRDLVRRVVSNPSDVDLSGVPNLSYKTGDGQVVTEPDRPRIQNLDAIPSPFLTGTIPLGPRQAGFPYDYALIETNRGCPYKCSFCYWGGAIGQKVRSFSRERLAAELDLLAYYGASTVFLCDANFGMLEADEEFTEELIRVKERYGHPLALEANWAKNKSDRFRRIVKNLRNAGLKSSFTVALQTLTDEALVDMNRRNMKINQWEELVDWLTAEGLECFAEMIWGAPGDTPASFLEGYDRLARRIPRIAVYPLLLLPNTEYMEQRARHGFVTVRGEHDDFEYVLGNRSSSIEENLRMQRFMYLARIVGENQYFKHLWVPARELGGWTQSAVISSLLSWIEASADPDMVAFRRSWPVIAESPAVARGHRMLYSIPALDREIERWWNEVIVSSFPPDWREFGAAVYEFERWCRPVYEPPGTPLPPHVRVADGDFVSIPVTFPFDMVRTLEDLAAGRVVTPRRQAVTYEFHSMRGFYDHLDNHETGAHYFARPVQISSGDRSEEP
jgi:radical SAM superfamily enzyme YgiQ (UPF0313 family)